MSQSMPSHDDAPAPEVVVPQQATTAWLAEVAATWAVRRALETGYHRVTGNVLPTARDRDVPLRRALLWAAVTAAAVAAANVAVDRVLLRPRLPVEPVDQP
jgi:multisubunit Na+/H+ antiporter MnhE subunit